MKISCDQSLPALYLRLRESATAHTTVSEECQLIIDPNSELVALTIGLREIRKEFPQTPIDTLIRYCRAQNWVLARDSSSLYVEFRRPLPGGRSLRWVVDLAVDKEGVTLGLDVDLSGHTDGTVHLQRLCNTLE